MSTLQIPAQSYLHYKRRPTDPIGYPMGPTTYGSMMYVVTEPVWVEAQQVWEVGLSAVNPRA